MSNNFKITINSLEMKEWARTQMKLAIYLSERRQAKSIPMVFIISRDGDRIQKLLKKMEDLPK